MQPTCWQRLHLTGCRRLKGDCSRASHTTQSSASDLSTASKARVNRPTVVHCSSRQGPQRHLCCCEPILQLGHPVDRLVVSGSLLVLGDRGVENRVVYLVLVPLVVTPCPRLAPRRHAASLFPRPPHHALVRPLTFPGLAKYPLEPGLFLGHDWWSVCLGGGGALPSRREHHGRS